MRRVILLIAIITLALFLTGCGDVFIQVETDGKGNLVSETYEVLSQDNMIGTQLSSGLAETYEQYDDRQKQCITVNYYRREAPFGGKIHVDHQKARDLGIELADISIANEDISYGIVDGVEFVTYRIFPDPDQAEQIISETGFLTITTSMPGREDHQFGRGLMKVLEEGVYYTVRSDGTEETLKPANFEDPNLEQAIREAIDKPTGPLYKTDLEGITTLDASEREIESLEGIQYLQNLQELVFRKNKISDISPLRSLTSLKKLCLDKNQISDISPLQNLTNLEQLEFAYNQVADITQLQKLTKLWLLYFYNNQVTDISPLANLTNLQTLDFSNNQVSDILPLFNLNNLYTLYFPKNQVSDISALANLTRLENLGFWNNLVSNISVLQDMANLEYLNFSKNKVTDISVLVKNESFGSGNLIVIEDNYLNLAQGSQNMKNIQSLISRGVKIKYEPQRVPNPHIELIPKSFDLGNIAKAGETEQLVQFTIFNKGDADLIIEKIIMENIFNFSLEIPFSLEPGEQIQAVISINASHLKEGEFRKAIRIMTNDSENESAFLRIRGNVR